MEADLEAEEAAKNKKTDFPGFPGFFLHNMLIYNNLDGSHFRSRGSREATIVLFGHSRGSISCYSPDSM